MNILSIKNMYDFLTMQTCDVYIHKNHECLTLYDRVGGGQWRVWT